MTDFVEAEPEASGDPAPVQRVGVMPTGREILRAARDSLRGRWGRYLLVMWIAFLCQGVLGAEPKLGPLLSMIVSGPFYVGTSAFALAAERETRPDWEHLLQGLDRMGRNMAAFFLLLFWIVLGTLLLVVPAVVWMLNYSQVFFVLADHPELSAVEALQKSRDMMYGHRLELVVLHCWLFGLFLLSLLTLGVALIWLVPYAYACSAYFYESLRRLPTVLAAAEGG